MASAAMTVVWGCGRFRFRCVLMVFRVCCCCCFSVCLGLWVFPLLLRPYGVSHLLFASLRRLVWVVGGSALAASLW